MSQFFASGGQIIGVSASTSVLPMNTQEVHGEESVQVYKDGVPADFDEDLAKKIMDREAVEILVQCHDGDAEGTAWGCDLTYDYVKINGDYRT